MDTELAVIPPAMQAGLSIYDKVPPLEFIEKFGKLYALTGAGGCQNERDGQLMALACYTERKSIFDIARRYHLMAGKLVTKAEIMLSDFRTKIGGTHEWIKDGTDGKIATLRLIPKDGPPKEVSFTIERAIAAKYVKKDSNWEKRPDQMLRSRCITDGLRMIAPEVCGGDYSEDEIQDVIQTGQVITTTAVEKHAVVPVTTTDTEAAVKVTRQRRTAAEMAAAKAEPMKADPAAGVVDAEIVKPEVVATVSPTVVVTATVPESSAPAAVVVTASTTASTTAPATTNTTAPAAVVNSPEHDKQCEEMELSARIVSGIRSVGWAHDDILKMVNDRNRNLPDVASFSEFPQEVQEKLWDNIKKVAEKNKINLDEVPF